MRGIAELRIPGKRLRKIGGGNGIAGGILWSSDKNV